MTEGEDVEIDTFHGRRLLEFLEVSTTPHNLTLLRQFHEKHFYRVPFDNLSLRSRFHTRWNGESTIRELISNNRGGVCYETGELVKGAFEALGYRYIPVLAGILSPTRGPATHLAYVVYDGHDPWLFDVGYGARGPRGLLPLIDGATHSHPALSSKITRDFDGRVERWTVLIKEHAVGQTEWQPIYSFIPTFANTREIGMAHYFTVHSPESPLAAHKLLSLPTPIGRISLRDDILTTVDQFGHQSRRLSSATETQEVIKELFGASIPTSELFSYVTED